MRFRDLEAEASQPGKDFGSGGTHRWFGWRCSSRPSLCRSDLRSLSLLLHELTAERALRFVLVVRTAAEPEVLDGRDPSPRNRHGVVILDEISRESTFATSRDGI